MKTIASVVFIMVVGTVNFAQADSTRAVAGQKESKEVKAQRAKDRKDHQKYMLEITRSR